MRMNEYRPLLNVFLDDVVASMVVAYIALLLIFCVQFLIVVCVVGDMLAACIVLD